MRGETFKGYANGPQRELDNLVGVPLPQRICCKNDTSLARIMAGTNGHSNP